MKIVLASASPRRSEILSNLGLDFEVIKSDVSEIYIKGEKPKDYAMRLSLEKGMCVSLKNKESLIISADTIVVFENQILEKPKDRKDAINMIQKLSGKTHQVITGISLINLSKNKKIVDYSVSLVTFKELSDSVILDYINTNEYKDKAGGYGIQGFGALLVDKIEGDYFNIVGLPVSKIYDLIKQNFEIDIFMESD